MSNEKIVKKLLKIAAELLAAEDEDMIYFQVGEIEDLAAEIAKTTKENA